jgi:hypothetical protein
MLQSFINSKGLLVLSKQQQKKLFGGGTCAAESAEGLIGVEEVSKAEAIAYASSHHTHWCCDSCHSAGWYAGDI